MARSERECSTSGGWKSAIWILVALIALSAAVGTGCKSADERQDWEDRVFEVRQLQDRGKYEAAEQKYRALLEEASSEEEHRYVQLQLARLAADRQRWKKAVRLYEKVWSASEPDDHSAPALTEAARILDEQLERGRRARKLRRRLVHDHPESTGAEYALEELARYYADQSNWKALRREFESLYEASPESALADDVLFRVGLVLQQRADRPDLALEYYERILENHPDSDKTDDAEWEAGQLYVQRQNWARAKKVLGRLAERVDASWAIGSFNSPYASKARYELGILHLTHLDDYDTAVRHFERYLEDFPRNRNTDDAAWHLAQCHRLKGDREAYRRALRRLVEEFPESRYVRRARKVLGPSAGDDATERR